MKIHVVIKDYFNEFNHHDRKVESNNNDVSRNDLGKLLIGPFINKNGFLSEEDVHKIFNLVLFDTLNKAYLAWFEEKDEIVQAQDKKKEY